MQSMRPAQSSEIRKLLLTLVGVVVVVDAVIIGVYYALHIAARPERTQQTFVAVWVVLTLLIVSTMMKRIRQARRRR